ncbi:MAG: hypothetical protein QGG34_00620 [SAR202 cluster bacterium]|nr:hypothetical protein [SAR202 cluster bacterium]MDP6299804.1 hypothetical protein [SAR202 cluster bacterium]MDP7102539.1 hypothetical protein [SAR202 cluster bacterium]MDP7223869.1 hypothetical protein [SAR202 cluster bacterium]MDP7412433.1 hypothetical protein [SAR202 cluster bacterium]
MSRLKGVDRHRLLAQHVLAGVERVYGDRVVGRGRRCDGDGVETVEFEHVTIVGERVRYRELFGGAFGSVFMPGARGDHIKAFRFERGSVHRASKSHA